MKASSLRRPRETNREISSPTNLNWGPGDHLPDELPNAAAELLAKTERELRRTSYEVRILREARDLALDRMDAAEDEREELWNRLELARLQRDTARSNVELARGERDGELRRASEAREVVHGLILELTRVWAAEESHSRALVEFKEELDKKNAAMGDLDNEVRRMRAELEQTCKQGWRGG